MQGAAWTVPVVAMAVATPAFAASLTPTLFFTQDSYTGVACGTISGATVQLTTDGQTPAGAGQPITVALPAGWTFEDGSTTFPGVTDGSGRITLPNIKVPIGGGYGTLLATSGSLTDTATVSAPPVTIAKNYISTGGAPAPISHPAVPAGSETVGWGYWLAPNGDLYNGDTVVASGVTSANIQHQDAPTASDYVTYVANGVAQNYISTGGTPAPISHPAVPAGSEAVGWGYWLAPNGDLYHGDAVVASNVTSADVQHVDSPTSSDYITYVENGVAKNYISTGGAPAPISHPAVPAGSEAVGWGYWLAPNGDLYHGDTVVASGVTSAYIQHQDAPTESDYVTYVANGVAQNYISTGGAPAPISHPAVPAGSEAVGWGHWLAPNGDLYHGGTVIASNVTSADVQHVDSPTASDYITYVEKACS